MPRVDWLKNGEELALGDGDGERVQLVGQYDLSISNAATADAGRYTCRAHNEVGQLDTEFELEVIGKQANAIKNGNNSSKSFLYLAPPQFAAEGERNFEVIEGEAVTLVCPVEANPFPEISWLHGIETIEDTTANVRHSSDRKRLTLLQAALADGGKYVCRASNVAGQSEVDLALRVLIPPRIDKSNLVNNPLAILGKEVFLECPVTGIPQPSVTWLRNGHAIGIDEEKNAATEQRWQFQQVQWEAKEGQQRLNCMI